MAPVIALLSDFGLRDHYVGTMKGVMLGIAPDAVFVDLTHDIPPHDIQQGSLQLAAACGYFPPATIFLAVVDPGVGSARRALAVQAGGYHFVAPDNGLLTAALAERPAERLVEISAPQYARPAISRTFEGRDRFGPAAAWLARGTPMDALGPPVAEYLRLDIPVPSVNRSHLTGAVLFVDRFGNAVTNVDRATFERFAAGSGTTVAVAGRTIPGPIATYAEIAAGSAAVLFGSSDHLEVAVNGASAAEQLGLRPGAPIVVERGPSAA